MTASYTFEETVRLLSGRNVQARIVYRLEPTAHNVLRHVVIEHVENIKEVRVGARVAVPEGEDVLNQLGGGEKNRLFHLAERDYASRTQEEAVR